MALFRLYLWVSTVVLSKSSNWFTWIYCNILCREVNINDTSGTISTTGVLMEKGKGDGGGN